MIAEKTSNTKIENGNTHPTNGACCKIFYTAVSVEKVSNIPTICVHTHIPICAMVASCSAMSARSPSICVSSKSRDSLSALWWLPDGEGGDEDDDDDDDDEVEKEEGAEAGIGERGETGRCCREANVSAAACASASIVSSLPCNRKRSDACNVINDE